MGAISPYIYFSEASYTGAYNSQYLNRAICMRKKVNCVGVGNPGRVLTAVLQMPSHGMKRVPGLPLIS